MSPITDFGDRVSAAFVDVIAIFAVVGAWSFGFAALGPHPLYLQGTGEAVVYAAACLLLPTLCEAYWGATPGKLLCGLQVVGADGRRPRFRPALLRSLFKYGLAPILVLQVVAGRQGGHDRIGGTRVVRAQVEKTA